jgi:hypothetical protein
LELCRSELWGVTVVVTDTFAGAECDGALTETAVLFALAFRAVLLEVTVSVATPFAAGFRVSVVGLTTEALKSVRSESLTTDRVKVVGLHVLLSLFVT